MLNGTPLLLESSGRLVCPFDGSVAQMVEHRVEGPSAAGSMPARPAAHLLEMPMREVDGTFRDWRSELREFCSAWAALFMAAALWL